MIPKNERIPVDSNRGHWRIWLYGESCTGKTYLADKFPNVFMINTDGNVTEVGAPRFRLTDQITQTGSVTKKKLAWDVFKDLITELETVDTTYETICLDLIEDFYEFCRTYMYKKMGITHESDANFKAWDMVRTEFYGTIRRLFSLPYNFIMISQEDKSRDIMAKNGDKITSIRPNINEKVAIKLMGMTTICARLVKDGNVRTIEFKSNDSVFGGSRIPIAKDTILCSYENLMEIINQGHATAVPKSDTSVQDTAMAAPNQNVAVPKEDVSVPSEDETAEAPSRRRRRSKPAEEAVAEETASTDTSIGTSADTSAETESKDAVVEFGINSDEEDTAQTSQAENEEPVKTPRRRRIR